MPGVVAGVSRLAGQPLQTGINFAAPGLQVRPHHRKSGLRQRDLQPLLPQGHRACY
jgi:hypothetical protein